MITNVERDTLTACIMARIVNNPAHHQAMLNALKLIKKSTKVWKTLRTTAMRYVNNGGGYNSPIGQELRRAIDACDPDFSYKPKPEQGELL